MVRFLPLLLVLLAACGVSRTPAPVTAAGPVRIEAIDGPATRRLFGRTPVAEELFGGMQWSEGPLVLPDGTVVCSDVPNNVVLRWTGSGSTLWLTNSGDAPDDYSSEPGSNGLALDAQDRLLLAQHGSRRIARMDAPLDAPAPIYTALAERYNGKRFNSPNDLVVAADGSVLFTDPPYGLPSREVGEMGFSGVFRVDPRGRVTLLTSDYSRPNGIGLSPDGRTLYLANSDGERPIVTATPLSADFTLGEPRVLIDGTDLVATEPGYPDGLTVAGDGTLFATSPGGVWVLRPDGRVISKIRSEGPVSNVTLSPDEAWLYLTNNSRLLRVKLNRL
ncbi:SMP-30/gluconolactonase/LRE family protein [Lewinella sp. IMCC34183]|uniref:SMP-30/gluconolactonase/LRE family protein n=1 Tax=Lewinella sp. IMCC34183 TaxID=2248762 RepID=UPI000E266B3B|nr:SMP-30/gluconolactonase/LRE family protein [Lewinella sp. IMCC34183]